MSGRQLLATLALCLAVATSAPAQTSTEGREAAEAWLALIDSGEVGKSWDEASTFFKEAINREGWEAAVTQARGPLGPLSSRNYSGERRMTEMPNAPPGDYLVIQYASSFEARKGLSEVVTMMVEDGQWKSVGYFVR
ncbi:MAG: DUF4019 domain-containing protein [Pseudomonadota bacterium]